MIVRDLGAASLCSLLLLHVAVAALALSASALEFMGEVFADFLGLYDSKYQYVVDAYERNAREVALERAERQEARREAREEARAEEMARAPARAREERDRQAHWAPPHASQQQVQPSPAAAAAASASPTTPSQDLPLLPQPSSPSAVSSASSSSSSPPASSAPSRLKVVFLCTGNSCRSILSEAMFNHLASSAGSAGSAGRFEAVSAGSVPRGEVLPRTLQTLQEAGLATAGLSSKSMEAASASPPDIVISVCDKAAQEPCPVHFGRAIKAHWGLHDPSDTKGTDEQIHQAFHATLDKIEQRCRAFLALPFEQLDQAALQAELNRIGNL